MRKYNKLKIFFIAKYNNIHSSEERWRINSRLSEAESTSQYINIPPCVESEGYSVYTGVGGAEEVGNMEKHSAVCANNTVPHPIPSTVQYLNNWQ